MINSLMRQAVAEIENKETRELLIKSAVEISSMKMKLEKAQADLELILEQDRKRGYPTAKEWIDLVKQIKSEVK